jgi:hypothetical protein
MSWISREKQPKPDKIFDMSSTDALGMPYTQNSSGIIGSVLTAGINAESQNELVKHGRYFYYTKDTARYARWGLAGQAAYEYSLGDPNADSTSLSPEQFQELNPIERFAHTYKRTYFLLGCVVSIAPAIYIAYEYNMYENLLPTLLIIPTGIFMFV